MFRGENPLIPVTDYPVPELIQLVSLLLEDMQKVSPSEYRMPCHNEHKNQDKNVYKIKVPVQMLRDCFNGDYREERSLK